MTEYISELLQNNWILHVLLLEIMGRGGLFFALYSWDFVCRSEIFKDDNQNIQKMHIILYYRIHSKQIFQLNLTWISKGSG